MVKTVSVLGSTGSIGCSTLDLISRNAQDYQVRALTAWQNADLLVEQARTIRPDIVVIGDEAHYPAVKEGLSGTKTAVLAGEDAISDVASEAVDWVMAAIVGAAGLKPTLNAIRAGADIALANKECLVCAGDLFMHEIAQNKGHLLPVDSEHNAIYQVFDDTRKDAIDRIILTASGGPFRGKTKAYMKDVTPEQAVAHPNWTMGAKISVDSASMMNKGLELIEAHHIFGMPSEKIDVVVHPQSIIHSMVEYSDGSVLAQMGTPDMRTPIAYCMSYPKRMHSPVERLDFSKMKDLSFHAPDIECFPALRLAREALKQGGSSPIILNAVNEVAVAAFLSRKIGFLKIVELVEDAMNGLNHEAVTSLDDVWNMDEKARAYADQKIGQLN